MELLVDSREHKSELPRILGQFDTLGVKYAISKLFVGDYQSLDNARLVIDRKKDLQEIVGNVTQQHERFKAELLRAEEMGIQLIILCEHGEGIKTLADVHFWENPRLKLMRWSKNPETGRPCKVPSYPKAVNGDKLYKTLCTIAKRYNVRFEFCDKDNVGERIVNLLGGWK